MKGKIKICFWHDGTWCFEDELLHYGWKVEDYAIAYIPEESSDNDIDTIVAENNKTRRTMKR